MGGDVVRGLWRPAGIEAQIRVLLVPERVLAPDDIAVEVLKLCDGKKSVGIIADELAARYVAPREEILRDVIEMLQDLAESGFLVEAGGQPR